MKNWNYQELINAIDETFNDQLLQGLKPWEALGVTSENFIFYPLEDYKVENFITLVQSIFLSIKHLKFVYATNLEKYNNQKKLLTKEELKKNLLQQEYDLFITQIGELELLLASSDIKHVP